MSNTDRVRRRRVGHAGEHTPLIVLTEAVFHAAMFALNAFAAPNVCERLALGRRRRGLLVSVVQMRVCETNTHTRAPTRV